MAWRADGGASTPEAWLADVASALLHRQPRTAVHCCDMALHLWVERPGDRDVLHFVRGLLVAHHVGDPRSAVDDLGRAAEGPAWLRDGARAEAELVRELAAASRVRKPRVRPAPDHDPGYAGLIASGASSPRPPVPHPLPEDGARPGIWDEVLPLLKPV